MDPLWLLKGPHEAPGWAPLEQDARSDRLAVLLFDRDAWALVRAPQAPVYEGLAPAPPEDGLYLDQNGRGVYIVGRQQVRGAREVLAVLGPQAERLLETVGDPDAVLERLGRVF